MNLNQVTVTVADLHRALDFYRTLGLTPIVIAAHYVRFECPQGEATFSIHLGQPVPGSSVVYFEVPTLDATVARLKLAGLVFDQDPRDEPWLWREARLRDPDGHLLCLYAAGSARKNPPWRVAEPQGSTL